jgi:hypothetical protein
MAKGISTNRRVTALVQCLRGQGIEFVCRYYSRTTAQSEKRLTRAEANAIFREEMRIVAVYEDGPTNARYFSRARGLRDGASAFGFAQEIGQPDGSAIYFTVDYDARANTTNGPITEYFEGVKEGLASSGAGAAGYEIGVYGSGRVCSRIKEQKQLAKYSWLAESTAWAGSSEYATSNIKQSIASGRLCGLPGGVGGDYEDNETSGDFGAFSGQPVESRRSPDADPPDPEAPVANASSDYVNQLAALTRKQFDDFNEFDESDPPLRDQIRRYWEGIGFDFPGVSTAWSAVFVSWCIRTAGASPDEFKVSTAHSRFVFWAIQNQLNSRGLFRGHPLSDHRPVVGDIIQNNRGGQTLTYDFARAHEGYESHSAIVVEAGEDGDGRFVRTIGGNESNSVGRKRVALTSDGFVLQRDSNPYISVIQNLK